MGDIEHTAELMFQLVGSPVVAHAAPRQTVVSHTAAPHNLRTVAIVIGLAQDGIHTVLQCAQNSLGQRVGERHIIVVRVIALHGVHHHVGHASSRLVRRQGEGAFGIHNGKLRPRDIVRITQLHVAILVRDNTSLTHLASGSRDGKHRGNGQTADSLSLTHIEVPHITLVDRAVGNGLG